jgi:hypothetical protein
LAAEEVRRRAEDRRGMQAFLQTALTAILAMNVNRNDRNYDGRDDNNPLST